MRLLKWWSNFLEDMGIADGPGGKTFISIAVMVLVPTVSLVALVIWPVTLFIMAVSSFGYILFKKFEKLEDKYED